VARRLCGYEAFDALKEHIQLTAVQESILHLDIVPGLYRQMYNDRATARIAIGNLARIFQNESDNSVVTVWFYVNKDKVIEAQRRGNTTTIDYL
jgi:hypothetical protein